MTEKSPKPLSLMALAKELEALGYLKILDNPAPLCVVVERLKNWGTIAAIASTMTNGTFLVRKHGVCMSKGVATGWLLSFGAYNQLVAAKEITRELTGEEGGNSVPSNARFIWNWAIPPSRDCKGYSPRSTYEYRDDLAYHTCTPGEYRNCVHYDIKGCHWHLLQRLKTRILRQAAPGCWVTYEETPNEKARLRDMFQIVSTNKLLRNSMWGSCLGAIVPGKGYRQGERVDTPTYRGTAQTAAFIVARLACEITHAAVLESEAYYSQTDSIICHSSQYPNAWKSLGIPFEEKARGDADIRYQHRYKMAGVPTEPFKEMERRRDYNPIGNLPERLFVKEFL